MTVLVLSAHPDDAEIAMGGTIAALHHRGTQVVVSYFTVSERDTNARQRRRAAAEEAAEVLGHRLEWIRGGTYDQVEEIRDSELVGLIDAEIERWNPTTIVTHWEGDSHADHVRLARATIASSRRCPSRTFLQFSPNEFRTPAYPGFVPQLYSQISQAQLDLKLRALTAYVDADLGVRKLELDAIALIARARGLEAGTELAETYRLVRQRIDVRDPNDWLMQNPFG